MPYRAPPAPSAVVASRVVRLALAGACGYALGCVPSADLAARASGGADLRAEGTGNPGGLNVANVLGPRWGAAVSALDVAKGAVAGVLGRRLAGSAGANLAASAAVAGHCFPIGRRGGKGVATSIGQVAATFPVYLPVDIAIGSIVLATPITRRPTRTATTVASAVWVGAATLWWRRGLPNPGGPEPTVFLPLAAVATAVVIAVRFSAEAEQVDAAHSATDPTDPR